MAQVNPLTREVLIKLVYYGPGLGGKTTTLQKIHSASPPETRGKIVSLATPVDRTLYFDFMPLRVGPVHGFPVRLQLFTVPGQVYFNATRKLVLTNADGVIFVADSQRDRQDANLESLQNLTANLAEQERALSQVPHVFQYNKRDLSNLVSIEDLDQALNHLNAPSFESSAARGLGVLEPLDELVRLVLIDLEKRAVFGSDLSPAEQVAPKFGAAQEGLRESVSRASEEWNAAPSEPAPLPSVPSIAPVSKRTLPPCYSVPPRTQSFGVPQPSVAPVPSIVATPAVAPSQTATQVPPSSVVPSQYPAPALASSQPLPAPPAIPLPSSARFQSVEPPPLADASSVPPARSDVAPVFAPEPTSFSWSIAFAPEHASVIREIEQSLAHGNLRAAMLGIDTVCSELLAQAAESLGLTGEGKNPVLVALALGFDGVRFRQLQKAVHKAQQDLGLNQHEALDAFGLLLELARLKRASD